jgi:hypothetical protein
MELNIFFGIVVDPSTYYPRMWNDVMHSPYLLPTSPSASVAQLWYPPTPRSLSPLSPPSTPPFTQLQSGPSISPLRTLLLQFHQGDEALPEVDQPVTLRRSASPPLSAGPHDVIAVPATGTAPLVIQSAQVARNASPNDYTDGGVVSTTLALPVLCRYLPPQFSYSDNIVS